MRGICNNWWLIFLIVLVSPTGAWAKAHEECTMCHGNRLGIGLAVFTKKRKIAIINPNTGKELERIETICLNCHGDEEYKAQLKELGAELSVIDDTEAKPEGTTTPLDEMMLAPVDVGFRIIDLHESHPVGIVPQKVVLPDEAKGFKWQENELTCTGCHDHHPNNTNYKYLRWPTNNGKNMNSFCAHCHPEMVGSEEREQEKKVKKKRISITGE
jgi:hypothetical protein